MWRKGDSDADGGQREQNYRYWVLWLCPTVRFLDYQKVKDAERQKARELFGSAEAPTELASRVSGNGWTKRVSADNTDACAATDNGCQEQDV